MPPLPKPLPKARQGVVRGKTSSPSWKGGRSNTISPHKPAYTPPIPSHLTRPSDRKAGEEAKPCPSSPPLHSNQSGGYSCRISLSHSLTQSHHHRRNRPDSASLGEPWSTHGNNAVIPLSQTAAPYFAGFKWTKTWTDWSSYCMCV